MENIRSRVCIWLVNVLLNYRRLTLRELDQLWRENEELSGGSELSRLKLHRAISSAFDMLGVAIECDLHDHYRYYIAANENLLAAEWVISSYTINQIVVEGRHLRSRILFEGIPSGQYHLSTIVQAMKRGKALEMDYRKFADSEPITSFIEPYCVKLSQQRWYLLGRKDHRPHLQVFALDRIRQLRILNNIDFEPPADFHASDYFSFYFGVHTGGDQAPNFIRIRANKFWSNYLRTLPIHHSQRVVQFLDDGCIFEFLMATTPDLVNHLLSYGPGVEVLEPHSLREQMRDNVQQMALLYDDNPKKMD